MSQALSALRRYLTLTEALLGAARAQEWETLANLSAERGEVFGGSKGESAEVNLAAQLPRSAQESARKIIERCQVLDVEIRALTEERQQALRVLLRVGASPS